jgi:hypothetical protein
MTGKPRKGKPRPKHGGPRPGVGRRPGAKSRKTIAREKALALAAKRLASGEAIPDAFKGDAHALLCAIYQDPLWPTELRIEAAKAALAFEKPKPAPEQPKPPGDTIPLVERLKYYERRDAIEESKGKVVVMRRPRK